ncbi:MAG TPA: serine hydrolase domain-containing protein [Planctomycetota bacterium]|nr:serine hydrolase domain-containing protein [Planctomycetota bacterium]
MIRSPFARASALALCVALGAPSAAFAQKPKPSDAKPGKSPPAGKTGARADPDRAPLVDGEVGARLEEAALASDPTGAFCGSVLVAAKGKVLLRKSYGLSDAKAKVDMPVDALWDWASVTKQFTAAALLTLQDAGKLKLDDPLSKHLPDVPADKAKVTVRHLLRHTSGMEAGFGRDWKFEAFDRASFERCALSRPMVSAPGEAWQYSNSGYALAAAIVERVAKTSFEEYCAERLFKPAKMTDATFIGAPGLDLARVPRIDRGAGFTDKPADVRFAYGNRLSWGYRGSGGAVATVQDMYLWDRALRGDAILSERAKAELYAVGLKDYALGWNVRRTSDGVRAEHGGGVRGVVTHYLRLLDQDVVVALALSFAPDPSQHPQRTADALARIALKG